MNRVVRLFCGDFLPTHARYEHVSVLGDSPTSVELLDRLRDFCTSTQRRADDYVVVYLTGHGEILDNGDYVVLAADTRPTDLLHRTVPTSEIVRLVLALLLPLAYSQGSGMPWEDIWPRLADALSPGNRYGNNDLFWLRTAAGSYAVEGVADG